MLHFDAFIGRRNIEKPMSSAATRSVTGYRTLSRYYDFLELKAAKQGYFM